MSAIGNKNELIYNPNNYLNRSFRDCDEPVPSRWERCNKIFEETNKFNDLSHGKDVKISSLIVYMLFRVDNQKFEFLAKMLSSRNADGIAKYVDKNHIPLMCSLPVESGSDSDSISGADSKDEQSPPSDKSEDKIASSSEGSAKPKRRKKVSRSSNDECSKGVSSFIFTPKAEESVEELPYMPEQRAASSFPISSNRFVLSDEAKRNLRGERGADHFVDLKHINEAMVKILRKTIPVGKRYAPTYQVGPDKFLRVVVQKFPDNLAVVTCYYMTRSEVERGYIKEGASKFQAEQMANQLSKLSGNPGVEFIRAAR